MTSRPPHLEGAASSAVEPSPVKTRFPTARIKRIMQADEEVGKVAQQTPIAVGKALELFMIALVQESAEVARTKGQKRVSAQMLKEVVEHDDQWDFLREIVAKASENEEKPAGRGKAKADTDSDDDSEPKKKRGGGRRKKSAAE
jgi:histone H3/H4